MDAEWSLEAVGVEQVVKQENWISFFIIPCVALIDWSLNRYWF